jgi:hypothetical protein
LKQLRDYQILEWLLILSLKPVGFFRALQVLTDYGFDLATNSYVPKDTEIVKCAAAMRENAMHISSGRYVKI